MALQQELRRKLDETSHYIRTTMITMDKPERTKVRETSLVQHGLAAHVSFAIVCSNTCTSKYHSSGIRLYQAMMLTLLR